MVEIIVTVAILLGLAAVGAFFNWASTRRAAERAAMSTEERAEDDFDRRW